MHRAAGLPLYVHVDMSCRIPPPQVTEQDASSLQADQAPIGHDWVLQCSSCVRVESFLPKYYCVIFKVKPET